MFETFPFWPVQASTMAWHVDALYVFLLLVSAVTCAVVFTTIAVFAVKYRRHHSREAEPMHGSLILEIGWSILPVGVFLVIFAWGAVLYFHERTPPRNSTEVYTVAKQWMWKFQHPEGQREINELHVPVGQNVRMIMTSQDVIHSFYVPSFRIKQDVLPGRYVTAWFKATKPGTYHLFCAEYCGTMHSGMIGQVVVMDQHDYQAWLTRSRTFGSLAAAGQSQFDQLGCPTCHKLETQGRGPTLNGVFGNPVTLEDGRTVIADENYIRESIMAPGAKVVSGFKNIMPVFQGLVSEEQMNELVAYIKSLSTPPEGSAGNPTLVPPGTQPQHSKD
jgi:cytochrome c oxidase subunit 2